MRSLFTKRIQKQQQNRSRQSSKNNQTSNESRSNSRRKYIQVYSKKKLDSNQVCKTESNLKQSCISLPIKYEEIRPNLKRHGDLGISKSQILLPQRHIIKTQTQPRYHIMSTRNQQNRFERGHSMPTKTIIVRQIIKPIPINFSYMQPSNVNIQNRHSYRMSLPVQAPNKCQILNGEHQKKAAAPINLFSHIPICSIQPNKKQYLDASCMTSNKNIIESSVFNNIQTPMLNKQNIRNSDVRNCVQTPQIFKNSFADSNIKPSNQAISRTKLSNQSYLNFQICIKDIAVNKDFQQSLKTSKLEECFIKQISDNKIVEAGQSKRISRVSYLDRQQTLNQQNYQEGQLTITQLNQQENFKQNLLIQVKIQTNHEQKKILGQILSNKTNKKQSLKPKKKFIFV